MPQKLKSSVKPDDPAEYERFLEAAKAAEASNDPKEAEKAFKKVTSKKKA